MARVFIGIPTINRPELVKHTINSVLAQTFDDYEVVVSDNCSEGDASAKVKTFVDELNHPRVRFYQQAKNEGEYGQGRYFMSQAGDSEFFMILHDDDILQPTYLQIAVDRLQRASHCAYFVTDPYLINENGESTEAVKQAFLRDHGRFAYETGEISARETHLKCGFTPISGTLFRTAYLQQSGFVEPAATGNYPFECDLFLRLCDLDVRAWYEKAEGGQELMALRFHSTSMRNYIKMRDNDRVISSMIALFEKRQYSGYAEKQRRSILGSLHRAKALIEVRRNNPSACREHIKRAIALNKFSLRLWCIAPLALLLPAVLPVILPQIPANREAPVLQQKT